MVSRSHGCGRAMLQRCKKFFESARKCPVFFSLGLYCGLDGFVEYDKTVGREVFFVARGAVIEKK